VSGLRAGRYYVAAVPEVLGAAPAGVSREYLEGLKRVATAVDLNDGERRSLDLAFAKLDR